MTGPTKLLLLLTQLRKRIKIEAVYGGKSDGKGFNLRVLAYFLQLTTNSERERLITKECGSSIDVRFFGRNKYIFVDCMIVIFLV